MSIAPPPGVTSPNLIGMTRGCRAEQWEDLARDRYKIRKVLAPLIALKEVFTTTLLHPKLNTQALVSK
jgi:hypothetical protein